MYIPNFEIDKLKRVEREREEMMGVLNEGVEGEKMYHHNTLLLDIVACNGKKQFHHVTHLIGLCSYIF